MQQGVAGGDDDRAKRGVNLRRGVWEKIKALAESRGQYQQEVIEEIVDQAFDQHFRYR